MSNRKLFTGQALQDYFKKHTAKTPFKDIYIVKKELKVFKKALSGTSPFSAMTIVNLRLPIGTLIHADDNAFTSWGGSNQRKMRASQAVVHSMAFTRDGSKALVSYSSYDRDFTYRKDKLIHPTGVFRTAQEICTTGIHFFMNVQDALSYHI